MTQEAVRDALVEAVRVPYLAAYPNVPIVFPNAPFDRNSPPPIWVEYEIKFNGAGQVGMSQVPRTRVHGFLYVTVWAREGTGVRESLRMLDWFSEHLAYRSFDPVLLQAAEPVSDSPPVGWNIEQLKLYFYTKPA